MRIIAYGMIIALQSNLADGSTQCLAFESLDQVREISAGWLPSYNEERPHDTLAGLPPVTYRVELEARSSPLAVAP